MDSEAFWTEVQEYLIEFEGQELSFEHPKQKYLWVIDAEGFKILREQTKHKGTPKDIVCHTNITGGQPAIQGGEVWLSTDKVAYVNPFSGRYGALQDTEHGVARFEEALKYMRKLGIFSKVVNLMELPP